MTLPKRYTLVFILFFLSFKNSNGQTFTTEADTVFANVNLCPTGNLLDTIHSVSPAGVNISWTVIASNFPADWYAPSVFGVTDNYLGYSNGGYSLWNGSTGSTQTTTYSSTTSPLFYLSMYMSTTTTAGTYWMEILLKDNATSYSKNIWFVVTRIPSIALPDSGTITGLSSTCLLSSDTLTNSSALNGTWSASNGHATFSPNRHTVVVTGASTGIDTIMYTVSNGCATSVASKIIEINPAANAGTILGQSTLCQGTTVTLTDSVTTGAWRASNGNATILGGVVTAVNSGTDTIIYTVTNTCGNTATVSKRITIDTLPNAGVITGTSKVCMGSTIILADSVSGGIWHADNGNAFAFNDTIIGYRSGVDTITYSVSNTCGTAVVSQQVFVVPLPTPPISFSASIFSTTPTFVTYQWLLNGYIISGATNYVYTPITYGRYNVMVTDSNGCLGVSQPFYINEEVNSVNVPALEINIYPNPAASELVVSANWKIKSLSIYNLTGCIVYSENSDKESARLNIASFPPGVYFIKINGTEIRKFVKQ